MLCGVVLGSLVLGGAGVGPGDELRLATPGVIGHLVIPARPGGAEAPPDAARWAAVKARAAAVLEAFEGPDVETLRRVLRCRLTLSWTGEPDAAKVPDLLLSLDYRHDLPAVGRLLAWFEDVTILDGEFTSHDLGGWPVTRFFARKPAPFTIWYTFRGSHLLAATGPEILEAAILSWKGGATRRDSSGVRAASLSREPGTDFALAVDGRVLDAAMSQGAGAAAARLVGLEAPVVFSFHVRRGTHGLHEVARLEGIGASGLLDRLGLALPEKDGASASVASATPDGLPPRVAALDPRRAPDAAPVPAGWRLRARLETHAVAKLVATLDLALSPFGGIRRRAAANRLLRQTGVDQGDLLDSLEGSFEIRLLPRSGGWTTVVRTLVSDPAGLRASLDRLAEAAGGAAPLEVDGVVWHRTPGALPLPGLPAQRWYWTWDGEWLLCADDEAGLGAARKSLPFVGPDPAGVEVAASLASWLSLLLPRALRAAWPREDPAGDVATTAVLEGEGQDLRLSASGPDGLITPLLAGHALAWLETTVKETKER